MKKVYCLRHAKSSWADINMADHERPLNQRGKRDAPNIAQRLVGITVKIDVSLVSSATRAQQTAAYFHEVIEFGEVSTYDKIYHASTDTLIDVIMDVDDQADTALLVGHNPGFSFLHNTFADKLIDNLPTCGLFCLDIDALHWSDIDKTNTKVSMLIYPKMFK